MDKKELLVIIPAYNEAGNIQNTLDGLDIPEIRDVADVLVINDASRDATVKVVGDSYAKVIAQPFNMGYGTALQTGYKYAVRHGYRYVIQIDADGQHDISNVMRIYNTLITPDKDGNLPDIVVGSRFMEGSVSFPISGLKKIGIKYFSFLLKIFGGLELNDPTSGLQGLSERAFMYYSQYDRFDDRYPDANMLAQMHLLGCNIVEVPAIMHERTEGVSMHAGIVKPIIYMARMTITMLAIWARYGLMHEDKGEIREGKVFDHDYFSTKGSEGERN